MVSATRGSVDDPALRELIGESYHDRLMEEIELLDMAGTPWTWSRSPRGS